MDLSREFGTKELREAKVAEMARKYHLSVDAFFEIRALVDAAYDSGERNGRMCLLANQANQTGAEADELRRLRAAVTNARDALKWAP